MGKQKTAIISSLHFQAKELYHTRCLELERLKRENATPKEIEKVVMYYYIAEHYSLFWICTSLSSLEISSKSFSTSLSFIGKIILF